MREEKTKNEKDSVEQQQIIVPYGIEKKKMIICDVCGYANPEYTAICKNCSNDLERS
ncbi:MAG: hypothetical protein IKC71_00100 [Clostridia bacterium]|nr:hypothetical protein [Clostridia bacterium]